MNIGGNINSIKNISIADIRHKPEVLGFGNQELELWMRKTSGLRIRKIENRYERKLGF